MKTINNHMRYTYGILIGTNTTFLHEVPNISTTLTAFLICFTAALALVMFIDLGLELKDWLKSRKSRLRLNKKYYIWQNNFVYYKGTYIGVSEKTFAPMFKIANGSIIEATYENVYTEVPTTYKHVAIL